MLARRRYRLWFLMTAIIFFSSVLTDHCLGQAKNSLTTENPFDIKLVKTENDVEVFVGTDNFTVFRSKEFAKPILYPIHAPGQISVTRNWPMQPNVVGEPSDHPHHKSLWVGHIVNGIDFWTEKEGGVEVTKVELNANNPSFTATANWIRRKDGQVILTEETVYSFGANDEVRWIDLAITFSSSTQDLHFEDTKEGTFAIRMHPSLQLTPVRGEANKDRVAEARNSEGLQGKEIWGKKARWVLYQGAIENNELAIALFDHPKNLRHPTTWHARDYGLVAANPFGLHEFSGQPPGEGEFVVKSQDQLTLRYRTLLIRGKPTDAEIETWYQVFIDS